MGKIVQASARSQDVYAVGLDVVEVSFDRWSGQAPNTFSVRNETAGVIYVGRSPSVTADSNYMLQVGANYSTSVFSILNGVDSLYLYCPASGKIHVDSFYAEELDASSLPQTVQTVTIHASGAQEVMLGAAIPAGTNTIGKVGISGALPTGANHIGSVGLDYPLPAGTNDLGNVGITGALPVGNNKIGNVGVTGALPAGTNTIGKVGVSGWELGPTQFLGRVDVMNAAGVPKVLPRFKHLVATEADTEYYHIFGVGSTLYKLCVYIEDGDPAAKFYLDFFGGNVATKTDCAVLPGNGVYVAENFEIQNGVLYLASSQPGKKFIIEAWLKTP